jgi:glutathione S-transferase
MSLRLYYAPGACSLAPHIALAEAGADYDLVRVVLSEGEQHKPDYRAINPRGRVPTLLVDGKPLTEVPAILAYLAQRFPQANLLPADPFAAAKGLELASWIASTVHPSFAQIFRGDRFTDDAAAKEALKTDGAIRFQRHLAEIEALFTDGRPWILGDTFSVLDAYALVVYRWAPRLAIDQQSFPGWTAQVRRLYARPSVLTALAQEGQAPEAAFQSAAA